MKKVIAKVDRPRPADFGIVERIGRYCKWDDGVFVYDDGEGEMYFYCEVPLCENGDRIEVGGLYDTCYGMVQVISMNLSNDVIQRFKYTILDGDGYTETFYGHEFYSIFW